MIGEIDHVYYWVRDMDAAVAFYRDVLGLPLLRRDGDEWAEFDAGPIRLALHGGGEASPGNGTSCSASADLDEVRIVLDGPRRARRRSRRGGRGVRPVRDGA